MLPEAHLGHQTSHRIRIRVPSERGNLSYFSGLKDALSRYREFEHFEVNPQTASVLIIAEGVDVITLSEYAEEKGLFTLQKKERELLLRKLVQPIEDLNHSMTRLTEGALDLPSTAILVLSSVAVYQIVKGNFRLPNWYTAFWYAIGIFINSIINKSKQIT